MTKPTAAANAAGLSNTLDDAHQEIWHLAWLLDILAREIIELPHLLDDGKRDEDIDRVDALACIARDQAWSLHRLIEGLNSAKVPS